LSLDRKAYIDILTLGQGDIGATMLPAPEGVWGMPPEMLKTLPGYDPDVAKNQAEAKKIMEKLGYGPSKRLATKVSVRNIAPAPGVVILHDQKKKITTGGGPKPATPPLCSQNSPQKTSPAGPLPMERGPDDPDQVF